MPRPDRSSRSFWPDYWRWRWASLTGWWKELVEPGAAVRLIIRGESVEISDLHKGTVGQQAAHPVRVRVLIHLVVNRSNGDVCTDTVVGTAISHRPLLKPIGLRSSGRSNVSRRSALPY